MSACWRLYMWYWGLQNNWESSNGFQRFSSSKLVQKSVEIRCLIPNYFANRSMCVYDQHGPWSGHMAHGSPKTLVRVRVCICGMCVYDQHGPWSGTWHMEARKIDGNSKI